MVHPYSDASIGLLFSSFAAWSCTTSTEAARLLSHRGAASSHLGPTMRCSSQLTAIQGASTDGRPVHLTRGDGTGPRRTLCATEPCWLLHGFTLS